MSEHFLFYTFASPHFKRKRCTFYSAAFVVDEVPLRYKHKIGIVWNQSLDTGGAVGTEQEAGTAFMGGGPRLPSRGGEEEKGGKPGLC